MAFLQSVITELNQVNLEKVKEGVDSVPIGDSNAAVSVSQTGVQNLITELPVESIEEDVANQVTYNAKAGITLANGSTVREIAVKNSTTGQSKTRNLTEERLKGADQIFWFRVTNKVRVRNGVNI